MLQLVEMKNIFDFKVVVWQILIFKIVETA